MSEHEAELAEFTGEVRAFLDANAPRRADDSEGFEWGMTQGITTGDAVPALAAPEDPKGTVLLEVDDEGVATITLNRPGRRNAWNPAMERRYHGILDLVDGDPRVRVAILTGAGTSFCPGVDSARLDQVAGKPMDLRDRRSPALVRAFRKPLIAAVNGACAGMGMAQALMCDVRFAARGAKFATSFARRGLAGEYGVTWLLPRMIGLERSLDLLLSGRTFDSDEALTLGLVSRVCEPDELLDAVRAYARDIARNCSPAAMAVIKHQVLTGTETDYEVAMRQAYRSMAAASELADFREGIDSYLQKRPPQFPPLEDDFVPSRITGGTLTALDIDPMAP